MSKRNKVISSVLFIVSLLVAVLSYVLVFNQFEKVWWEFWPIYILSLATFVVGVGIWISALLLEKRN